MKKNCRNCINYKYCSHSYGMLLDQVECDCKDFVPIIDSYSGAPSKESWFQKSDTVNSMVGAHQVESKVTNFDRELAAMTPRRLAKLYSKVTECLWCNCREICREIGSTRNCAEVLENWLRSEVKENET